MALTAAGRLAVLNNIESTFVKVSVGGTYSTGSGSGSIDLPSVAYVGSITKTPTDAGSGNYTTITWTSNTVFTIDLDVLLSGVPGAVTISYVRLLDASGTELMRRNFASTYSYAGNGTFTVTSIAISLT